MAMLRTLMSLAIISGMLIKLAMAASYTVGGQNGGWDSTTNLQTWASSQSFLVGDSLIFKYAPNHDVVEVSKADYDSCQANNPIQSYTGGTTTIPLSSPGNRYFICGTTGHCSQGMKVEIDTLAASAPITPSPASPPASSVTLVPTPTPESSTSAPAPESSTSSPAPVPAPESTSPQLLTPSPVSDSPLGSTEPSSIIPSTESTRTTTTSGSSTEPPPPSAAHKDSFLVTITMALSLFIMMMLQAF